MKFWYFKFDGWFSDDSVEYPGEGVFSECLVIASKYPEAELCFSEALTERKINLIGVEKHFSVDSSPETMDPANPDNFDWVEWCRETELAGKPTFDVFHLYPAKEVSTSSIPLRDKN